MPTTTLIAQRLRISRRPSHRRPEPETFEECMRLLEEAVARAERCAAEMEWELADLDRRTAQAVGRTRVR